MKFRSFGDSWAWSWLQKYQSKEFSRFANQPPIADYSVHFDSLRFNLAALGHELETFNHPAFPFTATVDRIISTPVNHSVDYNILWYSDPIRYDDIDLVERPSLEKVLDIYDNLHSTYLSKLAEWADANNQKVLIFGGQSSLMSDSFERHNSSNNVHLVSSCIVSDICRRYFNLDHPPLLFKLCDWASKANADWSEDLINQLTHDDQLWKLNLKSFRALTYPDGGHLNISGHHYMLDVMFKYIEDNF